MFSKPTKLNLVILIKLKNPLDSDIKASAFLDEGSSMNRIREIEIMRPRDAQILPFKEKYLWLRKILDRKAVSFTEGSITLKVSRQSIFYDSILQFQSLNLHKVGRLINFERNLKSTFWGKTTMMLEGLVENGSMCLSKSW
jgi:hypothetical protein